MKDEHRHCAMNNLYNSTYFCRSRYNHKKKVLCQGVTRKGWRGIPDSIKRVEVERRKDQLKVHGNVKAAVLEGGPGCTNLVTYSIYDTKPVHYLSIVTLELKWIVKDKVVCNVDTVPTEILKFPRMNNIHHNKSIMVNVDNTDQLIGSCSVDHWFSNRNW